MNIDEILEKNWVYNYTRRMSYQKIRLYQYGYWKGFLDVFSYKQSYEAYRVMNGDTHVYFVKEEDEKLAEHLIKKFSEKEFILRIVKNLPSNIKKDFDNYLKFAKIIPQKTRFLTNKQILAKLDKYYKWEKITSIDFWILFGNVEIGLTKAIKKLMEEKGYLPEDTTRILTILSEPTQIIPIDMERISLLNVALAQGKKQELALKKHYRNFSYLPMYDISYKSYDINHFYKKLQEIKEKLKDDDIKLEIKTINQKYKDRKKNYLELIKKFEKDIELLYLFKFYSAYCSLKDYKPYIRDKGNYYIKNLFIEIAKRLDLTLEQTLFLNEDEITNSLYKRIEINKEDINKRINDSFYFCKDDKVTIITDKNELNKIDKILNRIEDIKEIKGLGVSPGTIKGKVSIILSTNDFPKFHDGEILVTSATRPDFVPLMKKALAIITNEGGLLSHAAIISRELKKPCIVGTGNATQTLHNKDFVEVDADNGVVRILGKKVEEKNKKHELIMLYTREFPLVHLQMWGRRYSYRYLGEEVPKIPYYVFKLKKGIAYAYQNSHGQHNAVNNIIKRKIEKDPLFIDNLVKENNFILNRLIKLTDKESISKNNFKEFLNDIFDYWPIHYIAQFLPLDEKRFSKNDIEKAMNLRKTVDLHYQDSWNSIKTILKKLYPRLSDLVMYISWDEIIKDNIPDIKELKRRDSEGVIVYGDKIITDKELERYAESDNFILKQNETPKQVNEIKGQGVSKGIVKGRVRIILREKEVDNLKEGEILISYMTTPVFMPAIKKASAFVTDEGGITSHAAIYSRELKKPCIVGTKIATSVLYDGDLVEVDANIGVVRILERVKENKNKEFFNIPLSAKEGIWFKLSDIPNTNYISLFAYNLINPIRDYPKINCGDYIKEGFVEWNNGTGSYHLKREQFNQEADLLSGFIINMTKEHKDRVKEYYNLAANLMTEAEKFKNLNFNIMSDKEILVKFKKLAELQRQNHLIGGILTFLPDEEQQRVSNAILNKIKDLIEKSKSNLNLTETWNILTTPRIKSFREQEEEELLEICIKILRDKQFIKNKSNNITELIKEQKPKLYNEIVNHYEMYCWLPYMYIGPANNLYHYFERIKNITSKELKVVIGELEEIKNKHKDIIINQEKILKLLNVKGKDLKLLNFASELVWLKGYRKDTFYHLFYSYEPFLREVAKRIGTTFELIGFLFPWEFEEALIQKKHNHSELLQRKK